MTARPAFRPLYDLVAWLWIHGGDGWAHTLAPDGTLASTRKEVAPPVSEPTGDCDEPFTVRERLDRYGWIYDVVAVSTGEIARASASGVGRPYALTFAFENAACEWARWLNEGRPVL